MTNSEIHFYIASDKGAPATLNILATGGTYRIKDDLKARGFAWTDAGWSKSVPAAASKSDADWMRNIPKCRVFVGDRLVHTGA